MSSHIVTCILSRSLPRIVTRHTLLCKRPTVSALPQPQYNTVMGDPGQRRSLSSRPSAGRGQWLCSLPGGLEVSRGTEAELPAVMELSRRLGEKYVTDPVPALYAQYVTDPSCLVVSVYHGDKQICTSTNLSTSQGTGLTGAATRIDPDYQAKGLFHQLHTHYQPLGPHLYNCFPAWRDWYGLSTDPNISKSIKGSKWAEVAEQRAILRIGSSFTTHAEAAPSSGLGDFPLLPASPTDLKRLAADPTHRANLWPGGAMVKNELIYDVTIPEFDPAPSSEGVFARRENGYMSEGGGVVSLGERLWCDEGRAWRYTLNLYGERADQRQILQHVMAHLPHARAPPHKSHIYLILCLPIACTQSPGAQDILMSGLQDLLGGDTFHKSVLVQGVLRVHSQRLHEAHAATLTKL